MHYLGAIGKLPQEDMQGQVAKQITNHQKISFVERRVFRNRPCQNTGRSPWILPRLKNHLKVDPCLHRWVFLYSGKNIVVAAGEAMNWGPYEI